MDRPAALPSPLRSPALALVRVTPARALTGIVVLSAIARSIVGFARATPTYFPDEYLYMALGRSIADSGHPLVRGGSAHFSALLEPLLTAPFWLIHDTSLAYHLIQVMSATAMSLVAIPIYLVCVAVGLRRRTAVLVAALTLCGPAFMYAPWIVAEPLAYPLALGAVAAATIALGGGSRRAQAAFLVLAAAATLARAQMLVLPLAYVIAALIVAARTRSFVRVAREQAWMAVVLGAPLLLVVAMRGRLLGVYSDFLGVDIGGVGGLGRRLSENGLVLLYGSGWIVVPGALVGIAVVLSRPRSRVELAYGAMAVCFGAGVLLQASIWGDLDRPQERYFLYAVPLLAPFFALTVERGWPWVKAHSLLAAAMIVVAAAVPLSGYATSVIKTQSPSLFGVYRIEQLLGTGAGALVVSLVAVAFSLVALALPRLSTVSGMTVGIGLACTACLSLTIAATDFDLRDSTNVRNWAVASDPAWVDHAKVGPATLVRAGASWGDVHLQLFWNRSIRRVGLLPGALPFDAYRTDQLAVGDDGTLLLGGRPVSGPIVADEWVTTMRFRHARPIATSPFDELLVPQGRAQLELYAPGFYRDGLLRRAGSLHLWPARAGGAVQGRLSFRLRAPGWLSSAVTVRLVRDGLAPLRIRVAPGTSRTITLRVCAKGRWNAGYIADRSTLFDNRSISLGATSPVWRPDAGACSTTT